MRISVSQISDVPYLKVILAPVISSPQNYLLSQIFYDSGSYSVNCTQRLYTPWSGWMELAPQPPQEGLTATSEKTAKTR